MNQAVVVRVDRAGPPGRELSGLRVAVKDLFDIAGYVTAAGNPWLATQRPALTDAAAIAALSEAGATIVAKTATDELAMGMFGVNTHFGTPPNPAAPDRVPGGSSSGSASLVAADEADLGIGTDTGGSIRVPAAFHGLVGLRPSHARVDIAGVRPMAPRFDTVGLLARQLDPVRQAWKVLVSQRSPRGVAALVLLTDLLDIATDQVAALTRRKAAEWAETLELELREVRLCESSGTDTLIETFWPLMSRELWQTNGAWYLDKAPVVGEGIGERILAAGQVTDEAVAVAEQGRAQLRERLEVLLDDAIAILPTAIDAAPVRTSTHAELMNYRDRNLGLVVSASLVGAPQLTLPTGRVHDPKAQTWAPAAASLLGLEGDDELLLEMATGLLQAQGPEQPARSSAVVS